jgi:hypothetical protein
VDIEMKWGKTSKENSHKRKSARKAVRVQEEKYPSWIPTVERLWRMETPLERGEG